NNISPANGGRLDGMRIYIDSGHGGTDPGATTPIHGGQIREADINQSISNRIVNNFRSRGAIVEVKSINSHQKLEQRVNLSRNFGANIFISMHNNSSKISSANGTESFFYNPMSKRLSQEITNRVSSYGGFRYRKSAFANYVVTRQQYFPAVLVEGGFITNSSELSRLLDGNVQQAIANAVLDGTIAYINSNF
ncbi:MAG: N-acetylmuramoyl-L-alanine amidase family protein, partial [Oscillospiraceae bacterium]